MSSSSSSSKKDDNSPAFLTDASNFVPPANGKISILHLVQCGLLREGSILTYNQHYIARVTNYGTLIPDWTHLPPDFIRPIGEQHMGSEYETPSAWATSVCKMTRAQVKAQRSLSRRESLSNSNKNSVGGNEGKFDEMAVEDENGSTNNISRRGSAPATTTKSSESRVAVNGWTACRVRLTKDDPQRLLGERLMEKDGIHFNKSDQVIEPVIALLRSELISAWQRERRSRNASESKSTTISNSAKNHGDHHNDGSDNESSSSKSGSSDSSVTSGSSDNLDHNNNNNTNISSDFVESESKYDKHGYSKSSIRGLSPETVNLSGSYVRQRKAAAVAADAISAAVNRGHHGNYNPHKTDGNSGSIPEKSSGRSGRSSSRTRGVGRKGSRKRKMSTANSKQPQQPLKSGRRASTASDHEVDDETLEILETFKKAVKKISSNDCPSALQQLTFEERLQNGLQQWNEQRIIKRSGDGSKDSLPPFQQPIVKHPELLRCTPEILQTLHRPLYLGLNNNEQHLVLCSLCCSGGNDLLLCKSCSEYYHPFCVGLTAEISINDFSCPTCSSCQACHQLDPAPSLLECDECGQNIHATCSRQKDIAENIQKYQRWVCDACLLCIECGSTINEIIEKMSPNSRNQRKASLSSASTTSYSSSHHHHNSHKNSSNSGHKGASHYTKTNIKVRWEFDFQVCGDCSDAINQAEICPLCLHTYSDDENASPMVCCDGCSCWVHVTCDSKITASVYDSLIDDEDAPYACSLCRGGDEQWPSTIVPVCLRKDGKIKIKKDPDSLDTADTDHVINRPKTTRSTTWPAQLSSGSAPHPPPAARSPSTSDAEMAGLLLCLTHSDVRFENPAIAYSIPELEKRFALPKSPTADRNSADKLFKLTRMCALCGLCGDSNAKGPYALGRLLPFELPNNTTQWAHVECVAWSWGPRSVSSLQGQQQKQQLSYTQFTDISAALQQVSSSNCGMCGRLGATVRCCAPIQCTHSSYHLPCLLLASAMNTPNTNTSGSMNLGKSPLGVPVVSREWRRALCPPHSPEFRGYLPTEGSVTSACYASMRVDIQSMPPRSLHNISCKVGMLYVQEWGSVLVVNSGDNSGGNNEWKRISSSTASSSNVHNNNSNNNGGRLVLATADFPQWALPPGIVCDRYIFACGGWLRLRFESLLPVDLSDCSVDSPYSVKLSKDTYVSFSVKWRITVTEGGTSATGSYINPQYQYSGAGKNGELQINSNSNPLYVDTAPSIRELVVKMANNILPNNHPISMLAKSRPYLFLGLSRQAFGDGLRSQVNGYQDLCQWAGQARNKGIKYDNLGHGSKKISRPRPRSRAPSNLDILIGHQSGGYGGNGEHSNNHGHYHQPSSALTSPMLRLSAMTLSTPTMPEPKPLLAAAAMTSSSTTTASSSPPLFYSTTTIQEEHQLSFKPEPLAMLTNETKKTENYISRNLAMLPSHPESDGGINNNSNDSSENSAIHGNVGSNLPIHNYTHKSQPLNKEPQQPQQQQQTSFVAAS
ncbi:hypothetical protein H4219_004491 [Mycoemilia scoparia]|uniref:PHD-type domain-containing protein n=1 Tax=Mycoemilia scoparia TaxID=417184 RepID=A0A9W7ZY45_9FUNG|nr:hypothetical protein H4219_004491 [Mycoemilia scoparia]